MTTDIEISVELPVSCAAVWAVVGDPLNDPLWCPRVLDAEQIAGNGPGEGARYRSRHRPIPGPASTQLIEITAWEPAAHRRSVSVTPDGELAVEYTLVDTSGGCRFTERDTFRLTAARRPLRPVFLAVKRRRIRQQVDCLAELLGASTQL
jgi:Polyketide cyclase / dehydrase and lipid transport